MVNLSEEELDFLIELQHEMLTQDKVCQAAPRFWVIEDKRIVPTSEDYSDGGYEYFDDNGYETIAHSTEELVEYINDNYAQKGLKAFYNNGDVILVIMDRPVEEDETLEELEPEAEDVIDYLFGDSLTETLNNQPQVNESIRYIPIREEYFIAPDTMFLTNRGAKKHLEANYYHYHKDAHTYAMTAWRSSEVKQLWDILDKINWREMKEEKFSERKSLWQKLKKIIQIIKS